MFLDSPYFEKIWRFDLRDREKTLAEKTSDSIHIIMRENIFILSVEGAADMNQNARYLSAIKHLYLRASDYSMQQDFN